MSFPAAKSATQTRIDIGCRISILTFVEQSENPFRENFVQKFSHFKILSLLNEKTPEGVFSGDFLIKEVERIVQQRSGGFCPE